MIITQKSIVCFSTENSTLTLLRNKKSTVNIQQLYRIYKSQEAYCPVININGTTPMKTVTSIVNNILYIKTKHCHDKHV